MDPVNLMISYQYILNSSYNNKKIGMLLFTPKSLVTTCIQWCGDETMTNFMLPCNKEKLNTGYQRLHLYKPYISLTLINNYCGRQEEPIIHIYRLKLRMHGTYVASFQQLRLDLQNEWNTQNWQPDHMCFDYLSRETSIKH